MSSPSMIPNLPAGTLRILPLGGLGEIGMNCMIFEYDDEILVVDCGLLFSDLEHFGIEFVIPDFSYLRERKEKVKAFLITHGHEDHIGALPFAFQAGIRAPIFASPFTAQLVSDRMHEFEPDLKLDLRTFQVGENLNFKHFSIQTVHVNHSIVDSCAFFIETPVGKVIHTGDFKMDPTPFYGKGFDPTPFAKVGQEGVLLLLSDSTNVERDKQTLSERVIFNKFEELFSQARGLTIVALFASNIGRMGQVFELAKKLGKHVALAGRSLETNVQLAIATGYLKDAPSILIPLENLNNYPRNQSIILSTGSQAELGSTLTRVGLGEHKDLQLQKEDLVILSSRYIPGNEKAIGKMINNLFRQGADVLYESVRDIHVSGHASRPELKKMLELVKPHYFVPIHGEYRHLVHHAKLASETGVSAKNTLIAENGHILEFNSTGASIAGQIEETRVLVEGRGGQDISKLVLKARRQMGETGVLFSLIIRNAKTQKIIAGPEMISKGLAIENQEAELLDAAKKLVRKVVTDYPVLPSDTDLQETIRIELRRFFNQNIGKKPVVLPIILDL